MLLVLVSFDDWDEHAYNQIRISTLHILFSTAVNENAVAHNPQVSICHVHRSESEFTGVFPEVAEIVGRFNKHPFVDFENATTRTVVVS